MRLAVLAPKGSAFPPGSMWESLLAGLRAGGADVYSFGLSHEAPEGLVVLNHQSAAIEGIRGYQLAPARCALVALEPPVTAPSMYRPAVKRLYGHVFAPSNYWARQLGAETFLWPQELPQVKVNRLNQGPVGPPVLINANKRSAIKGSLYGLRRGVIREFERRQLPLAVYGPRWRQGPLRNGLDATKAAVRAVAARRIPRLAESYGELAWSPSGWRGTVDDKAEAFRGSEVAIVIENSADYVSEKLFDAISNGLVPIYVGPDIGSFGIPRDVAIQVPPSSRAVADTFAALRSDDVATIKGFGSEWLSSESAMKHEGRNVLFLLGTTIAHRLRSDE